MTDHRALYEDLAAGRHAEGPKGTVVFVVFTDQLDLRRGDLYVALGLAKYLQRLGWGVRLWPGPKWDEPFDGAGDVAIVMIESYVPGSLPPHIATIAWVRNWTEKWMSLPYLAEFDAIWASSGPSAAALAEASGRHVDVVPIGVDHELFAPGTGARDIDVFSSANFWGDERELAAGLALVSHTHSVVWVGGGTATGDVGAITFPGPVSYFEVPEYYRRSTIVVDDQIPPAKRFGNQNSRLFESISAGAIPVTNSGLGLDELGLGEVPVFGSPAELSSIVDRLLADPESSGALRDRLAATVAERHGFAQRAETVDPWLTAVIGTTRTRTARSELLVWVTAERAKYNALLQANAALEARVTLLEGELAAEPSTRELFSGAARRFVRLPGRVIARLRRSGKS